MSEMQKPWQTPQIEHLDVQSTQGANMPNSDFGTASNTAFPNPS